MDFQNVKPERCLYLREKYLSVTPSSNGDSGIYRNIAAKDELTVDLPFDNLFQMFHTSVKKLPDGPCLGHRIDDRYAWQTYKAVYEKAVSIASALTLRGVQPRDRVAIYSINTPEWMIAMQACFRMNYQLVPLYDVFGDDAVRYTMDQTECSVIFISSSNWEKIQAILPGLESVHTVVYWGPNPLEEKEDSKSNIDIFSFEEFLQMGTANLQPSADAKLDETCVIMYTSGTTGYPKGVMLSHKNILNSIVGQLKMQRQGETLPDPMCSTDIFLSWLPLCHVMDLVAEELMLYCGARIGYWSGTVDLLLDDLHTLQPTLLVAPPRVWERVYAGAMEKVKQLPWRRQLIFRWAYAYKLHFLKKGYNWDKASPLLNRFVFSKVGAALGGRIRMAFNGSAPLAPHVEEFLRVALCSFFAQGYGLTECCGASCFSNSSVWETISNVGIPAPYLEYKLKSVPEMGYDAQAQTPAGEIYLRGSVIFQGYYKQPELTAAVFDTEGWFATGDIGLVSPVGCLHIIDRKKEIFKLSQGEYIVPERVENAYKQSPLLAQIYVYGASSESYLIGVCVPEEAAFVEAATAGGFQGNYKDLLSDPDIGSWLLEELAHEASQAGLKGFEKIKAAIVEGEPFTPENNLLTPTLKMKRNNILAKYREIFEAVYRETPSRLS